MWNEKIKYHQQYLDQLKTADVTLVFQNEDKTAVKTRYQLVFY